MIKEHLLDIFFPEKCVLCHKVLPREETDLCHKCRADSPYFQKSNMRFSFVAGWTGLWYYKDKVRDSILKYKFLKRRSYGLVFGRLLAMKIHRSNLCSYDVLTWVPIGKKRLRKRGFDQVEVMTQVIGQQLQTPAVGVLTKIRETPPQSGIKDASMRRANVSGAYAVTDPSLVAGKTVLLIDDILTTGATVSECARVLLTAGAKEVYCAALAVAPHDKKEKRR